MHAGGETRLCASLSKSLNKVCCNYRNCFVRKLVTRCEPSLCSARPARGGEALQSMPCCPLSRDRRGDNGIGIQKRTARDNRMVL